MHARANAGRFNEPRMRCCSASIRAWTSAKSLRESPPASEGSTGSRTRITTGRGAMWKLPFPRISPVPSIITGTTGAPVRQASAKAPRWNDWSFLSGERVPSGKTKTLTPLSSQRIEARNIVMMLGRCLRRSGT